MSRASLSRDGDTDMTGWKLFGQWSGPIVFLILYYLQPLAGFFGSVEEGVMASRVLAVTAWMLIWWISEAVPLPVTALLPMLLFPPLRIMTPNDTALHYGNSIVYLFFGGFILALGLERYRLHLRIALLIIAWTGLSPRRLVLGFMLSTAVLSMWISNTATAVMMLPMALSVLEILQERLEPREGRRFAVALLLGIAFAANIGGMATLIGTPPNIVFAGMMQERLNFPISFGRWMLIGTPVAVLLFAITYGVLVYLLFPLTTRPLLQAQQMIDDQRAGLGAIGFGDGMMLGVFGLTAGLWIGKDTLLWFWPNLGLTDTLIALLAVVLLFVLPADLRYRQTLLTWDVTTRLPWGILVLFGGGLCLAEALSRSGVIAAVAGAMPVTWPYWLVLLFLVGLALLLTEVMSNVALVGVLLPVLIGIATALEIHPLYLTVPATLVSSCAFMLPMATPPNAIVFGSGKITVGEMFLAGLVMNVPALVVTLVLTQWLIPRVFGV